MNDYSQFSAACASADNYRFTRRTAGARCAVAGGSAALFPYNPEHAVGTCAKCGREMIYNVPRLGPGGGFIHKTTMSFDCEGPQNNEITNSDPKSP